MPSGPGPISDDLIRQIAMSVPPPVARVHSALMSVAA
jgi:hypothetical protein